MVKQRSQLFRSLVSLAAGCALVAMPSCQTPRKRQSGSAESTASSPAPARHVEDTEQPAAMLPVPASSPKPKPPTLSALVLLLAKKMEGYEPSRGLCAALKAGALRQASVVADLEDAGARFGAPVAALLVETWTSVKQNDPTMGDMETLLMGGHPDEWGEDGIREGLPWMLALGVSQRACTKKVDAGWALALAHLVTSKEGVRLLFLEAFQSAPALSAYKFKWLAQKFARQAVERVLRTFSEPLKPLKPLPPAADVTVTLDGGGLGLECAAAPAIMAAFSPAVTQQGGQIARDSRVTLRLRCKNASKRRLMSESLVPTTTPKCMALDGAGEMVLPELEPGDAADVDVGPFLVSDKCGDLETLKFALMSSSASVTQNLTFLFRTRALALAVRVDKLDEDLPGSSVVDGVPGVGTGDAVELRLSARTSHGTETAVENVTHVEGEGTRVDHAHPLRAAAIGADGWAPLGDDIDVTFGKVTTAGMLGRDPKAVWMRMDVQSESTCEVLAESLDNTAAAGWRRVCSTIKWSDFKAFMVKFHHMQCSARALERLAAAESEKAKKSKEKALDKGAEKVLTGLAAGPLVDPSYTSVVDAIARLVELQGISHQDLTKSLEVLDDLVATPLYEKQEGGPWRKVSREQARQILLAEYVADITDLHLGAANVTASPVFTTSSTARLLGLRKELLEILIKAEVKKATQSLKDANAVAGLSLALTNLAPALAHHSCEVPLDLPDPTVATRYEVNRYVRILKEPPTAAEKAERERALRKPPPPPVAAPAEERPPPPPPAAEDEPGVETDDASGE